MMARAAPPHLPLPHSQSLSVARLRPWMLTSCLCCHVPVISLVVLILCYGD
uniref:Uncharacterized protein n=3 Tax=Anguilla anguilla TaxID=7936 RepID=A0A0E9U9D5_ANGAN